LVTVEEIIPIAKKPTITMEVKNKGACSLAKETTPAPPKDGNNKGACPLVREIEFIATGQSDAGIEFYSWDFNYDAEKGFKADVIIDKEGKQTVKLKAGLHHIAIKVVDNDGLESMEVIKLKVNGEIERQ